MYHRLNVHVYASTREVLRAINARLKPEALTRQYRDARHKLYHDVLEDHRDALELVRHFRL